MRTFLDSSRLAHEKELDRLTVVTLPIFRSKLCNSDRFKAAPAIHKTERPRDRHTIVTHVAFETAALAASMQDRCISSTRRGRRSLPPTQAAERAALRGCRSYPLIVVAAPTWTELHQAEKLVRR